MSSAVRRNRFLPTIRAQSECLRLGPLQSEAASNLLAPGNKPPAADWQTRQVRAAAAATRVPGADRGEHGRTPDLRQRPGVRRQRLGKFATYLAAADRGFW